MKVAIEPLIKSRTIIDPITGDRGEERRGLWMERCNVLDFASPEDAAAGPGSWCIVNGMQVAREDWETFLLQPGDDLTFVRVPSGGVAKGKAPKFSKNKALNTLLSLSTSPIWLPPFIFGNLIKGFRKPKVDSPTYSFEDIQTTVENGTPVPIAYGRHAVGGQYINTFKTIDSKGQAVLHALIALSEGPITTIAGLATDENDLEGAAIPDGIRINGIEANQIDGLKVSWRTGTADQDVIGGFTDTTVNVLVGQTVFAASPVTYDSTSAPVDAFSVILNWPGGLIYIGSKPHTVHQQLRISYQKLVAKNAATVAANWIDKDVKVEKQTTSPFSVEFPFHNLENGYYAVKVTRLQSWDDGAFGGYTTQFDFDSINEITYGDSFSYPNTALLAIKAIPTQAFSGGLPTVNTEVEGRICWVWTSGPVTAPVFSNIYTNNPAWCCLDLLLSIRYGGGTFLTLCNIDLQSFQDWADYCDELIDISDGFGTLDKRFECNGVVDGLGTLYEKALEIAASARATLVSTGAKIRVKIDRPANPVQLFTMGNILKDTFVLSQTSRIEKPNFVEVEFQNEDDKWNKDWQKAIDPDISKNYEKRGVNMTYITKGYQAARQAQYLYNVASLLVWRGRFDVPIDALAAEPGDVVGVAHDAPSWGTKSGRIFEDAASSTTIKLDAEVTVPGVGSFLITVRTSGTGVDVFQTRTINSAPGTYPAGTSLSISVAWNGGDFPKKSAPWSGANAVVGGFAARLFRLDRVSRRDGLTLSLEMTEYNAAVYADTPVAVVTTGGPPNPGIPSSPPDVTDLAATEIDSVQIDGSINITANVSWEKPAAGSPYSNRVYYKTNNDDGGVVGFSLIGETQGSSFSVGQQFLTLGETYTFAVTSVDLATGLELKPPASAPQVILEITGSQIKPPDVTGFAVAQVGNQLNFTWDSVAISNLQGYEIRTGALWEGGTVVAADIAQTSYSTFSYIPNVSNQFWIKAKNTLANYSLNATAVSITPVVVGTPAIDQEEAPTWAGTKIGCSVQPDGSLTMDGGAELTWNDLTFTWDSAEALATQWDGGAASYETAVLDAGAVDDYLLQIGLSGLEFDSAMTWNDLTMTWEEANFPWLGQLTNSNHVSRLIEISLSDDNVTFTPFQPFVAGQYSFRYLKVRVTSTTDDPDFLGIMTSLHTIATPV